MPSRADRWRLGVERGLRTVALVAAVALAIRAWTVRETGRAAVATRTAVLDTALARWTIDPPSGVHLRADVLPTGTQREWLAALRRSGASLSWQGPDTAGAPGLVVEAVPSPERPVRLALRGTPRQVIRLADDLGAIDSATLGEGGVLAWSGAVTGAARAALPNASLRSAARDSLVRRAILVVGAADWETKFVVAALEEAGWEVRPRVALAPAAALPLRGDVRLDTAAVSAVIVLDSATAPDAAALRRFVESGGGAVIAGRASTVRSYASLLPATGPRRDPGRLAPPAAERPRESLASWSFGRLAEDAVALERRVAGTVVAARRLGAGRILQSGYDETWRWRMTGSADDAPDAHRAWWSELVAAVAYAPARARATPYLDEAPMAAAVATLGPPQRGDAAPAEESRRLSDAVLFAILLLSLLAEWFSRRLRGAR